MGSMYGKNMSQLKLQKYEAIILTGPESTGKTTLTKILANHFGLPYCTEYAREYIEDLGRPYIYDDVLNIAEEQISEFHTKRGQQPIHVFDTYLIITKIWLIQKFGTHPTWIDQEIKQTQNSVYLLCKPDIKWVYDPVRESGGEERARLYEEYEKCLQENRLQYKIIDGGWGKREQNAIKIINEIFR